MDYDIAAYGERRPDYDSMDWALRHDEDEASSFLAELAPGSKALELGIGTGRVALPLARRGLKVVGIEGSPSMAAGLERNISDEAVEVVIGDFADVRVEDTFDLIYCISETFFLLPTQESQIRCVQNAAERLADGGLFVVQAIVPDHDLYCGKQSTGTRQVGEQSAIISARRHDRAEQRVELQSIVLREGGNTFYPMSYRYVWPSELDLMAKFAGLTRVSRSGGWRAEPFTAASSEYVAVYRKS
ncbi:class I SAM-dependent methyltransferase [Streptomyces sp. NPDC026206]|uniref:class I SAM-dependent methyltransferase n=1 Tax=Streptomyces sp. NPDC026206 TaxID=3157089 RepID=UPI0033D5922A